jgi:hypothetical protein
VWLELRDLADLSRREDTARKAKKLLPFPLQHPRNWLS